MSLGPRNLIRGAKQLLSWALVMTIALAGMALLMDGVPLVRAGDVGRDQLLLVALCSVALSALLAAGLAPAAALLALLTRLLSLAGPLFHRLRWVPLVALALGVSWSVAEPLDRRLPMVYLCIVAGSTGLAALLLFISSRQRSILLSLLLLCLVGAALAADWRVNPGLYPELHMLAHLAAASGLVALLLPLQQRLVRARFALLFLICAGLGVATSITFARLEGWLPTWPNILRLNSPHASRLLEVNRRLLRINPTPASMLGQARLATALLCREQEKKKGGQASPGLKDSDIGLGPASGDPAYARGAVDLVLLVTVECLRQDALTQEIMPRLWRLSRKGALLGRSYAAGSGTKLSLPALHGLNRPGDVHVGEQLRRAGVVTSSVVGHDKEASKIKDFWQRMDFGVAAYPGLSTDATTDAAMERIDEVGHKPHYIWLHYYELHDWSHYRPAEEKGVEKPRYIPPREQYISAARAFDAGLARLFSELERRGRKDRTLIILTGDHGESAGERQNMGHGWTGYEEVVRVPILLFGPGIPAGRFNQLASHHDIPPTVLGAFAAGKGDGLGGGSMGRSLLRLRGSPGAVLHHFVVTTSHRQMSGTRGALPMATLAAGRYKIHFGWDDEQLELYDLDRDPNETQNLSTQRPVQAALMLKQLVTYCIQTGNARADICKENSAEK